MMTGDLRERLAETRVTANRMNATVDDAQWIVREVEKALNDMHIGVRGWVATSEAFSSMPLDREVFEDGEEDSRVELKVAVSWVKRLTYTQIKDEWRLVATEGKEYESDDTEEAVRRYEEEMGEYPRIGSFNYVGWSSLSRREKLDSVECLPSLVASVNRIAGEEADRWAFQAAYARRLSEALNAQPKVVRDEGGWIVG